MKKFVFLPIVFIFTFVFIVSAACGFSTGKNTAKTEEPKVIVVTATPETPVKVETEVATEEPTVAATEAQATEEAATTEAEPYFLDEFDSGDFSNYSYDIFGNGDPELVTIDSGDGVLMFDHEGTDLYSYVYYDPYTYTDVRIDLEAENLATNDNSVNIMCRYDPEKGWYEFDIDNDGEWYLYEYDAVVAQGYVKLDDGGSTAINMGRDTNIYTVICQGDELTLLINGTLARTVENKDIKEGQIGFGVSSYNSYPVKINFNWLQVSEP